MGSPLQADLLQAVARTVEALDQLDALESAPYGSTVGDGVEIRVIGRNAGRGGNEQLGVIHRGCNSGWHFCPGNVQVADALSR